MADEIVVRTVLKPPHAAFEMPVTQFYRQPGLGTGAHEVALSKIQKAAGSLKVESLSTELCFYVDTHNNHVIKEEEKSRLLWLLGTPFEEQNIAEESFLPSKPSSCGCLIEIGPRLNFSTAFSTNAVSMCRSIGLDDVTRIEYSTRYLVTFTGTPSEAGDGTSAYKAAEAAVVAALHDRMTQCRYTEPLTSFALTIQPEEVYGVDIMGQGKEALIKANADLGLAFDDWDLDYYTNMFRDKVKRNPTSVECFDLAQSNSEHSRHWFFKGRMVVDGTEFDKSLFQMVMDTQEHSNDNNVIKFSDNSSAIKGYPVKVLYPQKTSVPSPFNVTAEKDRNIIFTAETHNFPTGVAPFPGATTGTGGRIRDVQATGRGAHVVAGTAGYSFGNLHIPGYNLPWEDTSFEYPDNFASGLEVAIEASNGASDYGNKFGEPVLTGFARSYGLRLPNGERREWVKPIMFSGGIGSMDARHSKKEDPEVDMAVVKVGGPVYRIGVGGGAASSIEVQGDNAAHLDFGAVQRGDAEMEQKMNRVIRACIEQTEGDENPICSVHDQGAGGNGNVLKEICEPIGAEIQVSAFQLADPTLSVLELWGAEYQESNALLIRPEHKTLLTKIGQREKCDVSFVGKITGDHKIRLVDDRDKIEGEVPSGKRIRRECQYPVDLELEHVMGSMPRKVFKFDRVKPSVNPVTLPEGLTVRDVLDRVLRLPAVASKRYLTNKVDRSVTGLVAQQQCVGPLHTPLADVAVTALSYFDMVGSATSIGEQPIKGLLDPGRGARMSVGEALTNLVWAPISALKDVKCSGNWMWAAKLPGEGAALVDACVAMCDVMSNLGVAIDGGKDSLSMAARVGKDTVKAPGTLVVSAYAACPDITAVVTPDLKCPSGKGSLIYVPLGGENHRLGGSSLVQCFGQIGDVAPDMDNTDLFVKAFNVTQNLIKEKMISSGHDVSDGGLVTCVLEMAFAGNCGLKVDLPFSANPLDVLFAEELGLVMEVTSEQLNDVINAYRAEGIKCVNIGHSVSGQSAITISVAGTEVLSGSVGELRDVWEATSVQLEQLQTNPRCVQQEAEGLRDRCSPAYKVNFNPDELLKCDLSCPTVPQVAVIREEGSNGDREMVAAFHMAGFQVWDVNMQDLCTGRQTLDQFRGVVFVGGFSYADVCGSAKGWAATMKYNDQVRAEFDRFYARQDTFSLGVCNGCQLMALLGWVAPTAEKGQGVLFTHNTSERFESRFTTVTIENSPAVMLKGMQGSTLGIWVAHGEGRVQFKTNGIQEEVTSQGLVPIKYVDDAGQPTTTYPLNPNGSPGGAAALCSLDGRHLAMMPHPERCVLPWQWAWKPSDWSEMKTSPWLCMFRNAYKWCLENVE